MGKQGQGSKILYFPVLIFELDYNSPVFSNDQ